MTVALREAEGDVCRSSGAGLTITCMTHPIFVSLFCLFSSCSFVYPSSSLSSFTTLPQQWCWIHNHMHGLILFLYPSFCFCSSSLFFPPFSPSSSFSPPTTLFLWSQPSGPHFRYRSVAQKAGSKETLFSSLSSGVVFLRGWRWVRYTEPTTLYGRSPHGAKPTQYADPSLEGYARFCNRKGCAEEPAEHPCGFVVVEVDASREYYRLPFDMLSTWP